MVMLYVVMLLIAGIAAGSTVAIRRRRHNK